MSTPRRGPLSTLPREVTVLVGVAFFVALGFGIVAPAIPLFARQFGVSKAAASAVISAFALARLGTAPFAGRLVNRYGERLMLATGIGVVAVSSALAGLAGSYWQLLVLRGVGGVGSILFTVSSASLLIRVTPGPQRGRAQGVYAGGFLLGSIAGPVLGAVTAFSLRAPFFVYAGTLVVAGGVGLVALRSSELGDRPDGQRESVLGLPEALGSRAYRAALASTLAGQWAVVGVRTAIVPLFVVEALHLRPGWTYTGFFVASAVSGLLLLPVGRYADTRGRRPVLVAGLVAGGCGLALLAVTSTLAGLLVAMVVLGGSGAALAVAPGAIVGDVVGGRGGTVVATYQMAGDVGAVLGPLAAGWLADGYGYPAAFAVAALVTVLPLGVVMAAPETVSRQAEEPVKV
ncbi:MAG: MFS transporter [Actinobacteria bacterium]|nr:MFS transporter [Actinomycetota bacterium]MBI3685991.1 MFS transporter [Actinomycetota bacterium]